MIMGIPNVLFLKNLELTERGVPWLIHSKLFRLVICGQILESTE